MRVEITRVQQFFSHYLNEKNDQITQLQTQIQSLESEMIDVEKFKHQDLQVIDQLRQAYVHFCQIMGCVLNQQGMINDFSKIISEKEVELTMVQRKFMELILCQNVVTLVTHNSSQTFE